METEATSNTQRKPEFSPTTAASNFLSAINPDDVKSLLFSDGLVCYSVNSNPIGSYECILRTESLKDKCLLHIKAKTKTLLGEIECTSSLDAFLTYTLGTVYQLKSKVTKFDGKVTESTNTIQKTDCGFEFLQSQIINGVTKSSFSRIHNNDDLRYFISEGADLVLQRLMVRKGFTVPFEVVGLQDDNNFCMVSYTDLGERSMIVKSDEVTVRGIQRNILATGSMPSCWQNYFLNDGHLILRIQVGSPITIKVDSVPVLCTEETFLELLDIPEVILNWKDDMELHSHFSDRKNDIKAQYLLYLRDHAEVREMLSDFIQALLLHKPDSVIEYAVNYFKTFSLRGLPNRTFPLLQQ